jgi:DNA-binding MarR family transcriptional regulator
LGDTKGLTCAELSAATLVTKGTLTGVLDRLESKGLIRRTPVADDRRSRRICLTEKGDRLFMKTFAAHIAFLRPYFQRALTVAEAEQLRMLLLRLRQSFQEKSTA